MLGEVEIEASQGRESHRWLAQVLFVSLSRPAHERVIVGHAGFLPYFDVTFLGRKRELRLSGMPSRCPRPPGRTDGAR